jgi:hypothetical protein
MGGGWSGQVDRWASVAAPQHSAAVSGFLCRCDVAKNTHGGCLVPRRRVGVRRAARSIVIRKHIPDQRPVRLEPDPAPNPHAADSSPRLPVPSIGRQPFLAVVKTKNTLARWETHGHNSNRAPSLPSETAPYARA